MPNTISTQINPAIYGELVTAPVQSVTLDGGGNVTGTGPVVRVAPRPPAGTVVRVRDYITATELAPTALNDSGYLTTPYDMGDSVAVQMSTDDWATILGPFISIEAQVAAALALGPDVANLVAKSELPTKGDLLVGTGTTDVDGNVVVTRLPVPVGVEGAALLTDTLDPAGMKWVPGGAKSTYQSWLDQGNTGTEADFVLAQRGAGGPTGPAGVAPAPFLKSGPLVVGVGLTRWYNDTGVTLNIVSVRANIGTAPTGATVIADVNRNDVTIYTTQSARPTIPLASKTSGKAVGHEVLTVANGQYLTCDIDQIGSTVAGADLSVIVTLAPAA